MLGPMARRAQQLTPLAPGNIDLRNRPSVKNDDGTFSTIKSITITNDRGEATLIPTVINGRHSNPDNNYREAVEHHQRTGEHLGRFRDIKAAGLFADQLSRDMDNLHGKGNRIR